MNAAKVRSFAPGMGVRRPSEAKTGSASGTPGFLNLNLVRRGRKIREVILMWTHRLTVGLDVMPA